MRAPFVLVFMILGPWPLCAAKGDEARAAWRLRAFAEHLASQGLYREAAAEYQRYLIALPDTCRGERQEAWLRSADLYRRAGRRDVSLRCLDSLEVMGGHEALCEASILRARCYYEEARFQETLNELALSTECAREREDVFRAHRLLVAAARLHLREWGEIAASPDPQAMVPRTETESLRRLLALADECRSIRRPRPWVAGALSAIVPGAGRVYSGRTVEGLHSFVLHLLTAWQCVDGFRDDGRSSVKGWISGGIGLILYAGNVYGSVTTATQTYEHALELRMREADSVVQRALGE